MQPSIRLGITAAALLVSPCLAPAAPLLPSLQLARTNVATFDPRTFTAGPSADVYHLQLQNPNSASATSLTINFCAPASNLLNFGVPGLTFRSSTVLPNLGPTEVAESYFVIPSSSTTPQVVSSNVVDDAMTLAGTFSLANGGSLVPAFSTSTVAVLFVPTGSTLRIARNPLGSAIVGGQTVDIADLSMPFDDCVPEPATTALLAACGFAAASGRRQRKARLQLPCPPTVLPTYNRLKGG